MYVQYIQYLWLYQALTPLADKLVSSESSRPDAEFALKVISWLRPTELLIDHWVAFVTAPLPAQLFGWSYLQSEELHGRWHSITKVDTRQRINWTRRFLSLSLSLDLLFPLPLRSLHPLISSSYICFIWLLMVIQSWSNEGLLSNYSVWWFTSLGVQKKSN